MRPLRAALLRIPKPDLPARVGLPPIFPALHQFSRAKTRPNCPRVHSTKVTPKGDLDRARRVRLRHNIGAGKLAEMKRKSLVAMLVFGLTLAIPCFLWGQTDEGTVSLGDLARTVRQSKEQAQAQTQIGPEINNDNFSEMMAAAEQNKPWDSLKYSINSAGNSFQVSAPDVTCNLSFNSPATALLADPFSTRSLPDTEIAKLNGPARIDGDTFEISVYNGSDWTLREMTVALTIVHPENVHSENNAAANGMGKLLPAAVTSAENDQKPSDTTLLFHMKGSASAAGTAVFQKTLQSQLAPGDDWHWAIVDAKGLPPKPDTSLPSTLDPSLQPAQTQLAPQPPRPQPLPPNAESSSVSQGTPSQTAPASSPHSLQ